MTSITDPGSIDSTLLAVVRASTARLAGTCGFSRADRDDIRQELLFDCFLRLRRFDPAKSSPRTFLLRIVRHRVATLVEAQHAACRDYRLCRDSLDGQVRFGADESMLLGETVSADAYEERIGRNRLSSWERAELRIDVHNVVSLLPAELATIAVMLKSVSVVEAAQRLVLSRATVYRRINDIRRIFKSAGLDLYLSRSGTASVWHHRRSTSDSLDRCRDDPRTSCWQAEPGRRARCT